MWLKVAPTNSRPSVIARYFLDSVINTRGMKLEENNVLCLRMYTSIGAPSVLRCDLGTENSYLAWIQPLLCHQSTSNSIAQDSCFRYGRSVSNQV